MLTLVTGASGFLGRHLCRRLRKDGHQVVGLSSTDCDLRVEGSLDRFDSGRFDYIFHLASWTQAGDFCLHHPGEQWIINQKINTQVLDWWQRSQPQAKMIAIGSSCCYAPDLPLREEYFLQGEPIESLYAYAMTKRMLYVGLESLRRQFGVRYLLLVPSTLYGDGYHNDDRQLHFIFDLVRKILAFRDDPTRVPTLWGTGEQARELVHVRDFVETALKLVPLVDNEIVNIGAGEEHTIRWFAEQIAKHAGVDPGVIRYDTTRYVGAESKVLCIAKLLKLVPDYKPRDTVEGLRQLVDGQIAQRKST